jgi:hypothetical protein
MNNEQSCFVEENTYTPQCPIQLPSTKHWSTTNPNPSISKKSLSTYMTNGHNTSMSSLLLSKPDISVLSPISTLPYSIKNSSPTSYSFISLWSRRLTIKVLPILLGILLNTCLHISTLYFHAHHHIFLYLLSTIQHKFGQTSPKPSWKSSSNPRAIFVQAQHESIILV